MLIDFLKVRPLVKILETNWYALCLIARSSGQYLCLSHPKYGKHNGNTEFQRIARTRAPRPVYGTCPGERILQLDPTPTNQDKSLNPNQRRDSV